MSKASFPLQRSEAKRSVFLCGTNYFDIKENVTLRYDAVEVENRLNFVQTILRRALLKALLHGAIFHATCLAMALRDKLHESLHRLKFLAVVKIFARQVA